MKNLQILRNRLCLWVLAIIALSIWGAPAFAGDARQTAMTAQELAREAATEALDFEEGNLGSLMDAEAYFTALGWVSFLDNLKGFIDDEGAPVFSSHFTPTAQAKPVSRTQAHIKFSIPGILEHSRSNPFSSVTVYRAVVDLTLATDSQKIVTLKTRTCGGAKTVTSCD